MNLESRPNIASIPSPVLTPNSLRTTLTLADIGEELARVLQDKHDMELRLTELVHQRDRLQERLSEAAGEVLTLKKQIEDSAKFGEIGKGRQRAELAARERLIRDEVEREFQSRQIELQKERHRLGQQIVRMETDLSSCICRKRW